MYKATILPSCVQATFAGLCVLNNWLRKFPFYSVSVRFELRSQSKAVDTIVLQNLSLLADKFQHASRQYARKKINLTADAMFL